MTAKDITELLRQRYCPPEWAFFSELRVGTGYTGGSHNQVKIPEQRLDGWTINCWPSKGLTTIAFEIKVSRSDFLSEIANPDKRQQAISLSNEFYFVVPDGLIKVDEIPEECGLIAAKENSIRIVKKPVSNDDPLLNWHFVASIARRSGEVSTETYRVEKQRSSRILRQLEQVKKENRRLKEAINERISIAWYLERNYPELWDEIHRRTREGVS